MWRAAIPLQLLELLDSMVLRSFHESFDMDREDKDDGSALGVLLKSDFYLRGDRGCRALPPVYFRSRKALAAGGGSLHSMRPVITLDLDR